MAPRLQFPTGAGDNLTTLAELPVGSKGMLGDLLKHPHYPGVEEGGVSPFMTSPRQSPLPMRTTNDDPTLAHGQQMAEPEPAGFAPTPEIALDANRRLDSALSRSHSLEITEAGSSMSSGSELVQDVALSRSHSMEIEELPPSPSLPSPEWQGALSDLLKELEHAALAAPAGHTAAEATTRQRRTRSAQGPRPINQLPSEIKIDLSKAPNSTLDDLSVEQLSKLTQSLGLGALSSLPELRERQLDRARWQLTFSDEELQLLDPELDTAANLWNTHFISGMMKKNYLGDEAQTDAIAERLEQLADIAHFRVSETRLPDEPRLRLDFYFAGTGNPRDVKQHVKTISGDVGEVYEAARGLAEIVADMLAVEGERYDLNRVVGHSMGGGVAQAFAATLQSRIPLRRDPALVLFDPQLLNDAQAAHATKNGLFEYEYDKVRGVAITLDYAKDPRRGLMNLMKGPGRYKSPGLVQLRLGLTDEDGYRKNRSLPAKARAVRLARKSPLSKALGLRSKLEKVEQRMVAKSERRPPKNVPPKPIGPPGLGYHGNPAWFQAAIDRFMGWEDMPDPDSPRDA